MCKFKCSFESNSQMHLTCDFGDDDDDPSGDRDGGDDRLGLSFV